METVTTLDIETLSIVPICATYSDEIITGWLVYCNYVVKWMAFDPLLHEV